MKGQSLTWLSVILKIAGVSTLQGRYVHSRVKYYRAKVYPSTQRPVRCEMMVMLVTIALAESTLCQINARLTECSSHATESGLAEQDFLV